MKTSKDIDHLLKKRYKVIASWPGMVFKVGGLDAGTNHKAADITLEVLKEEIGGIFIYLDLFASLVCIDLSDAIVETFNNKSEKYGLIKYKHQTSQ